MIGAAILWLWLLLRFNQKKSSFIEASLLTLVLIAISFLKNHGMPEINVEWILMWCVIWLSIFLAMWWIEVFCMSTIGAVIYSSVVAGGFYFLQLYLPQFIHNSI